MDVIVYGGLILAHGDQYKPLGLVSVIWAVFMQIGKKKDRQMPVRCHFIA